MCYNNVTNEYFMNLTTGYTWALTAVSVQYFGEDSDENPRDDYRSASNTSA